MAPVNHTKFIGRRCQRRPLFNYITTRKWVPYRNCDVVQMARNHRPFLDRMNFMKSLPVHDGCVNTICWSKNGEYILSGSDDCNLCVTKPNYLFDSSKEYTVLHKIPTRHLGNIFSAQYMPYSGDTLIVSCASEGSILVHDINSLDPSESILSYNCHASTVYEVVPIPDDDKVFLSCSEDKTIRLFDLRIHASCARAGTCPHPALIRNSTAMTTLKLHPLNSNLMLVGRADGLGLVYDRRMLPNVAQFSRERAHAERLAGSNKLAESFSKYRHPLEGVVSQFSVPDMDEKYRFTSLCYNQTGSEVLASFSGDYVYLFNHDRSSNVELIQTLPKKTSSSSSSSSSTTTGPASSNDSNNVETSQSRARDQNNPGDRLVRGRPLSDHRIRLRGDWSDTGVNSVPYSRSSRRAANQDNQNQRNQASNFWQHMADVAFSLNSRRTGEIARLLNPAASNNSQPGQAQEQQQQQARESIEEEEEGEGQEEEDEEDEEEDEDEDEDDNSTVVDDDEEMHQINDDENDDDDDEQEQKEVEEKDEMHELADSTTKRLVDEATAHVGHKTDATPPLCSTADCHPKVSAQTRLKFRKTLDDLKDKYNHIASHHPRVKYQGHRNNRTSIKEATFWGDDYVMSGSDCGRIVVWEKETAKIVLAFQADNRVVNCLAPNPRNYSLASSGIDYDIKLWSTQSALEGPLKVTEKQLEDIVENNEEMIKESKQTISVPPHLFFRVLASLAHLSNSNNNNHT